MKRTIVLTIAVALTIAVLCAAGGGVWCVNRAIQAERTFHAQLLVMDLVCSFIERERRWPRSWDELREISPSSEGIWAWPDDVADVQERVKINFGYDLTRVEDATIETFDGITARGVSYIQDEGWLIKLKEVAIDEQISN